MPHDAPPIVIRARFLADHAELEELFAQLLLAFDATDRGEVRKIWDAFDAQLTRHLDAEERVLIPRLFLSLPREARVILEEHRHVRSRLNELTATADLHVIRGATIRGFIDELRAHARHEEEVLYRWADDHLTSDEQSALVTALDSPAPTPTRMGERALPARRAAR